MANNYDLICVFNPKVVEEKIESAIAKIEKALAARNGSIVAVNKMGTKKVATRMRKFKTTKDGIFVHINFSSETSVPEEITALVGVNEDIMRFILTKPIREMKSKKAKEGAEVVVEVNPEMLIGKPK